MAENNYERYIYIVWKNDQMFGDEKYLQLNRNITKLLWNSLFQIVDFDNSLIQDDIRTAFLN